MASAHCSWCGAPARHAQFTFGHCDACNACTKKHGGWREEDESPARPLAHTFPRSLSDTARHDVDDLL